jgi:hypothetical protein
MWGVLSDVRTGLSFTIVPGARQRSHSRTRVPNFTLSDSRLPFSSPPTTRRATVEVFDPASTREWMTTHECPLFYNSGWIEERPPPLTVRLLYSVYPLLRNVCQSRGKALISTSVFVATKRAFSKPLYSNGLFRHNIIIHVLKKYIFWTKMHLQKMEICYY